MIPARKARLRAIRVENMARGRATSQERSEGRYEDYVWLRTEQGHTIRQAGERLGITFRHAQRYERRRLDGEQPGVAA